MLNTLTNFVNESAKAFGLGGGDGDGGGGDDEKAKKDEMFVQGIAGGDAGNPDKVQAKLDEINAKLTAIKESVETNDVVVKTWFESTQ